MEDPDPDPTCTCAVCFEVLWNPVTLPCGHALDQRCAQRVVATATGLGLPPACPTCRQPLPAELPAVSVQLRDLVQRFYPEQVAPPLRSSPGSPRRLG